MTLIVADTPRSPPMPRRRQPPAAAAARRCQPHLRAAFCCRAFAAAVYGAFITLRLRRFSRLALFS